MSLYTIENIKGHDVTFVKLEMGDMKWICAYVRFDEPLNRGEEYPCETYNEGEVYGVDTNHGYNMDMSLEERFEDAKRQITAMIEAHENEN